MTCRLSQSTHEFVPFGNGFPGLKIETWGTRHITDINCLLCYKRIMFRNALAFALLAGVSQSVFGQQCPQSDGRGVDRPSQVRTLEGQLVFHNGIRKWFELKMDKPQCGQTSIQLIAGDRRNRTAIQVLRGCQIKSQGAVDFSPTGYYSLSLYQDVQMIGANSRCERQPPLPDYSKLKPNKSVDAYRVEMLVDYRPGDHPIVFHVTSGGKQLQPSQAYASYDLTGGLVLYGRCGAGFFVDNVFGTPQANPAHFTESRDASDMAMFDPESAAAAGVTVLHLGYTCLRAH